MSHRDDTEESKAVNDGLFEGWDIHGHYEPPSSPNPSSYEFIYRSRYVVILWLLRRSPIAIVKIDRRGVKTMEVSLFYQQC